MNGGGRHPGAGQLPGEPVSAMLGADEDQRPALSAGDLRRDGQLVAGRQDEDLMVDLVRALYWGNRVHGRIGQVAIDQPGDPAIQGCREQHPLTP